MKETQIKTRAERNRTLTLSDSEIENLAQNLIKLDDVKVLKTEEILNKTI